MEATFRCSCIFLLPAHTETQPLSKKQQCCRCHGAYARQSTTSTSHSWQITYVCKCDKCAAHEPNLNVGDGSIV